MFAQRVAVTIILLCLTGCMVSQVRTDLREQIHVFGIELYSDIDFREISGDKASEEPCLKGYERNFDRLGVTIGYGFNNRIRKITTRSPGTRVFGISPGISLQEGKRLALQAGFTESAIHHYREKGINLTLLVDAADTVFGITVETED